MPHTQTPKNLLAATHRTRAAASLAMGAGLCLASLSARGQEGLRNSMAGDAAAAAQAQAQAQALQSYTFKTGDFRLLAVPSLEMDWNDNVDLSKSSPQEDYILKPLLRLTGTYPLTQHNVLSLTVGIGYDEYLQHSQYSAMRVESGSTLSFDTYIKDFWINFHDRFQFTRDPSIEPGIAGTAFYGGLNNTAGLAVTWDLRDVVLTLGYDHQNFIASSSEFAYLTRSSELPLARAGFRFRPDLTVGVEGTASFTTYNQAVLNEYQSYSAGVYADWKPGSYLHIQPRAGYVIYQFDHTSQSAQVFYIGVPPPAGETIQTADLTSWYADLTLSHQITKALTYSLSAGHEIRGGIQSDVIEDSYVRPAIQWAILKDVSLRTSISYEHGQQGEGNVTGNLTETYDWLGANLSAEYAIMKQLTVGLNYRLTIRSANLSTYEYTQNLVGLQLTYRP
jgi:hypothetical protein